jgi:ABC-2 type transport system permease protein
MEDTDMHELTNAVWIELRKAIRSRVPLFTAVGFLLLPAAAAFLIFVVKDPQFARKVGLISSKADLLGRTADWPSYLGLISQIIAVAGLIFFSLAATWVFGREFADGTVKDLLAVPISREIILLAKFIVVALWCLAATAIMIVFGLILGTAIGLPKGSGLLSPGLTTLMITACLVIIDVFPVAFFASVGRGYLLPMGVVILVLILGNIAVIAGYGGYFPWSVPGLYTQSLESQNTQLEPISYLIVILTGLAGMAGTYLWWTRADQSS